MNERTNERTSERKKPNQPHQPNERRTRFAPLLHRCGGRSACGAGPLRELPKRACVGSFVALFYLFFLRRLWRLQTNGTGEAYQTVIAIVRSCRRAPTHGAATVDLFSPLRACVVVDDFARVVCVCVARRFFVVGVGCTRRTSTRCGWGRTWSRRRRSVAAWRCAPTQRRTHNRF